MYAFLLRIIETISIIFKKKRFEVNNRKLIILREIKINNYANSKSINYFNFFLKITLKKLLYNLFLFFAEKSIYSILISAETK